LIIGAGPAGLTAAYELVKRTDIRPVIIEQSDMLGGISRTVNYKGNRMDIGGHRFFSKSDRVMEWWMNILPLEDSGEESTYISYHKKTTRVEKGIRGGDPEKVDRVMLLRKRLSRIYYLRRFFDYPVSLNRSTIKNLGLIRIIRIGLSYIHTRINPIRKETNLEDFFINRFGKELYKTFFKDYTEKVWGVPCREIRPEWGSQRIKGLSVTKALLHGLRSVFKRDPGISQKQTETSLIERFLYPKFGPGHLWEEVAAEIVREGGEIIYETEALEFILENMLLKTVLCRNRKTGEDTVFSPDLVFSSMPVKDLIGGMKDQVPKEVGNIASGLIYRDFIAVGILLKRMNPQKVRDYAGANRVPDTWIYIQEKDVKVGRIQVFNNWSPYLVADRNTVWLGLEYFCNEGDEIWTMEDEDLKKLGTDELERIGLADSEDFIDGTVVRMPKTYPAYFGSYDRFDEIRSFTDKIDNLFLIGRNGMHKYNNQDHSMLTAMTAVDNLIAGEKSKAAIWEVNTEDEYHEETGGN